MIYKLKKKKSCIVQKKDVERSPPPSIYKVKIYRIMIFKLISSTEKHVFIFLVP